MDKEKQEFNYKEFEADAIKRLQNGEALEGKDGILAPLLKRLLKAGLNGELEGHLEESVIANRRNGKMSKQVQNYIYTMRDIGFTNLTGMPDHNRLGKKLPPLQLHHYRLRNMKSLPGELSPKSPRRGGFFNFST
jgi:hypothetical protein